MPRHLISDAHEWINEIPTVSKLMLLLSLDLFQKNEPFLTKLYSTNLPSTTGPYLLSSEPTAKGTGLEESAGKEDPVELDSSPTL